MKANELRIGNLVSNFGQYCFVINIYKDNKVELGYFEDSIGFVRSLDDIDIKPILLTEEWLLKFGFNKVHESKTWEEVKISDIDGEYMYWISGMYYLTQNGNWWSLYHSTDEDTYWQIHHNVQYVHQLQNLYFALTGEELEIKL